MSVNATPIVLLTSVRSSCFWPSPSSNVGLRPGAAIRHRSLSAFEALPCNAVISLASRSRCSEVARNRTQRQHQHKVSQDHTYV
jgi:hypothetical protein